MSDSGLTYEVLARDGAARRGRLHTAHGVVQTPAFMTVGTAGTVKGLTMEQVTASGAEIILGNTYHLMLRPGAERVASLGGLHKFMNWPGPILTDSGGFQVMSLEELRKITEEGVTFRSHLDGTAFNLTPERAVEIQELLDANITMVLDECTPFPASETVARESMERSPCAGPPAARLPSRSARVTASSASFRAASTRNCGSARPRLSRRSASTAMPSAAWR
jgi:queuine tRNA-ribosyltransferase